MANSKVIRLACKTARKIKGHMMAYLDIFFHGVVEGYNRHLMVSLALATVMVPRSTMQARTATIGLVLVTLMLTGTT